MTTPTSVAPFHATIGKPPPKSFAGFARDDVGNVRLSAREWAQATPDIHDKLKAELSKQLQGNPFPHDGPDEPWRGNDLTGFLRLTLEAVQEQITGYTKYGIILHDNGEPLERGRDHRLFYDWSAPLSFFHALGSVPFSSTDVFQRYLSHAATVESSVNGPLAQRTLASLDFALFAQTTCPENGRNDNDEGATRTSEDKDGFVDDPPTWSVLEGIANVIRGPFACVREWDIDTKLFSELSPQEQFWVPRAMMEAALERLGDPNALFMTARYPNGVPIGYSRFKDCRATDIKLALGTQDELATMTRIALCQTVFQLLATHEMFGTVYASALVCTRFARFYVLGANRVAVELLPASQSQPDTIQTRPAVPYSQLQTSRAFNRLPWSLTQDRIPRPRFPSVNSVSSDERKAGQVDNQATVDLAALQTYMTFGAAAAVRLASLDRTGALKRMSTPLQDRLLQDMTDATVRGLTGAGLPTELGLEILEQALGGERLTVNESVNNKRNRERTLNVEALECTLEDAAMYVPVSPTEMDELVAAQLQSDLDKFTPDDSPYPRLRRFGV